MNGEVALMTRSRIVIIGASLLAMSLFAPGSASGATRPTTAAEVDVAAQVAAAEAASIRSRVAKLRSVLASGSLAPSVAASLELVDADLALPRLRAKPRLRPNLAPAIAFPIARLEAAVRQAASSLRKQSPPIKNRVAATTWPAALAKPAIQAEPGIAFDDAAHRAASLRYTRKLQRLTLLIAHHVDEALAELGDARPSTGERVKGCDVLDALPALCIGGAGDNQYRKDAAVQVDLGGDDTYNNSAAAADPGIFGGGNGLFAATAIDLGGDDQYAASVSRGRAQVAIGSGFYGGIGILVDAAGNDEYAVRAKDARSQGAAGIGFGVLGGGVVADATGDDTYLLDTKVFPGVSQVSIGGGVSGEGVGLLIDGEGDDRYIARSSPVAGFDRGAPAGSSVLAFGVAAAAPGILFDGGGADRMVVDADASGAAVSRGTAIAEGFGFAGLGGVGMALTGDGDTTYRINARAHARRAGLAAALGMGQAFLGATGVSSDIGGDDSYKIAASAKVSRWKVASTEEGQAFDNAFAGALGLGTAATGAAGVIEDHGGDDDYTMMSTARAVFDTAILDGAEFPAGDGSLIQPAAASVFGQAFADDGGSASLIDLAGNDRYHAAAKADLPDANRVVSFTTTVAQAAAMDGGEAVLRDMSGADVYEASAALPRGFTSAARRTFGDWPQTSAQAGIPRFAGVGEALLLDLGPGSDRFKGTTPAACNGRRGESVWRDCGPGVGAGVNTSS